MCKNRCEYVNCNFCGSNDYDVIYNANIDYTEPIAARELSTHNVYRRHHRVVRCRKCGLVYSNPHDRAEEIIKSYRQMKDFGYLKEERGRKIGFNKIIEKIDRIMRRNTYELLDVGCSFGFLLDVARSNGWHTYGVELSDFASEYARTKLGLNVYSGQLTDFTFAKGQFNVITMCDILEHITDPIAHLRATYKYLEDEGLLVITTPNIESLLAKLFKQKWLWLLRLHIYYFSPNILAEVLRDIGFDIIEIGTIGKTLTVAHLVQRLKLYNNLLYKILSRGIKYLPIFKNVPITVNLGDVSMIYAKKRKRF